MGLADFDRPINNRGEKDAPRMAKRLKERGIVPDMIFSSPAKRAINTCYEFCRILSFPPTRIQTDKKLYHASEEYLLSFVQHIAERKGDKEETILLFGHNPGLTEFVNSLLNEDIDNIPTCGIVACTLKTKTWSEVNWGAGELDFFDYPKSKSD